MKVRLLDRHTELDLEGPLAGNAAALTRDLGLEHLLAAMAGGDRLVLEVSRHLLLTGSPPDAATIAYRQAVLGELLERPGLLRSLYAIAARADEVRRKHYWHFYRQHPGGVLSGSLGLLAGLLDVLRALRRVAMGEGRGCRSEGLAGLFERLRTELPDEYLDAVEGHLRRLRLGRGMLASAALGKGNCGTDYLLHEPEGGLWGGLRLDPRRARRGYTFRIHERDQAGARALADLRDRGLAAVATTVGRSAEHVLGFFTTLRAELAFYVGGLNLHEALRARGMAVCVPHPAPEGAARLRCIALYDPCLALTTRAPVVGNDLEADGRRALLITGPNQGGKTTLLRALGIAQLMMQCGLFAPARAFGAELHRGLLTHFPRGEDRRLERGKLDEELARASGMVDALRPGALLLLNESFAATNEHEGSEIARQVLRALIETGVKVYFVTHLHDLAHTLHAERRDDVLFLRAERGAGGRRTFKLRPGAPLATSFGADLYAEVFATGSGANPQGEGQPAR